MIDIIIKYLRATNLNGPPTKAYIQGLINTLRASEMILLKRAVEEAGLINKYREVKR